MGCLFRLVVLGLLSVAAAIVAGGVLATRPVGPAYEAGAFVYEADGARHEVRLTTEGARAFVYTRDGPFAVTLNSNLLFDVGGGRVRVRIDDVHAGRLPIQ